MGMGCLQVFSQMYIRTSEYISLLLQIIKESRHTANIESFRSTHGPWVAPTGQAPVLQDPNFKDCTSRTRRTSADHRFSRTP